MFWKSIVRAMETRSANRMNMPLATYKSKVVNELWMFGEQAVKENSADSVVSIVCSNDLLKQKVTDTVQVFIFTFKVTYNGCPLFRFPIVESPNDKDASAYIQRLNNRYPYYNLR
jgi:hypothetical protein